MFVHGRNTFITKTSITLDSGITSLVLIPLPDSQECVEDIGPRLNGSLLGSAALNLVPQIAKTINRAISVSAGSAPLSLQFQGVFSSSPLSSPPDSDHESEHTPAPVQQSVHWKADDNVYKAKRVKTVYKLDKKYAWYHSSGRETQSSPPAPPPGVNILPHSFFSHVYDHPNSSSKRVQLWTYIVKNQGSTGEWQPTLEGAEQLFNNVPYYVQWKDGKGASWVKQQ